MTRNDALADDLAQETFLKAYQRHDVLKKENAMRAWLFQIAYRCFLDHHRKEKRRKNLEPDPDESSIQHNTQVAMDVNSAMDQLSQDCRAVILLNLSHGYSHDQVSQILNMPLGTVKSHVKRGKLKLRDFLDAYETVG